MRCTFRLGAGPPVETAPGVITRKDITVTTASKREFVLIAYSERDGGSAWIVRRSDSPETIQQVRARQGYRSATRYFLGNTITGRLANL